MSLISSITLKSKEKREIQQARFNKIRNKTQEPYQNVLQIKILVKKPKFSENLKIL